jgi:hypothetical protein
LDPVAFKVKKKTDAIGSFANNDIEHEDLSGANHELFGFGLKKALLNYMHGACLDYPLHKWFDFKVPKTSVDPNYIANAIQEPVLDTQKNYKVIWIGNAPEYSVVQKSKKGNKWEEMQFTFQTLQSSFSMSVNVPQGEWLLSILSLVSLQNSNGLSYSSIKEDYEKAGLEGFELFWDNKPITHLYKAGLLRV